MISAGPEFNYLVSTKSKFDSETIDLIDFWDDSNLDFNRFEFGVGGSISAFVTDEFSIGLRYFNGLTTVIEGVQLTDDQGSPIAEDAKLANRTFQLSVAFLLN